MLKIRNRGHFSSSYSGKLYPVLKDLNRRVVKFSIYRVAGFKNTRENEKNTTNAVTYVHKTSTTNVFSKKKKFNHVKPLITKEKLENSLQSTYLILIVYSMCMHVPRYLYFFHTSLVAGPASFFFFTALEPPCARVCDFLNLIERTFRQ